MWIAIKQFFTDFLTAPLVTKLCLFISAFLAPVWKLYILLLFLTCIDFLIDITVWYFQKSKESKPWVVTMPFVIKIIMYSLLVITVHAVQVFLIENVFDFFKLVLAIPIISELLSILASIERYTGVALVDRVKEMISNWITNKNE